MRKRFGLAFVGLLVSASTLSAQTLSTGTLWGAVRDQSGAAVPGATVRVTGEPGTFRVEVKSDVEGSYRALQVPLGKYRVESELKGFRTTVHSGIVMSAGQSLRVDIELAIGATQEVVQVDGKVAQVDASTANVGSTIFGTQVQELALNTRSFTQLMTLQPGVNSNEPQQPGFGSNTTVSFSFNGGGTNTNNWLLDGGRNVEPDNGNNLTMPNLDAIAEVRIERIPYLAEYGRNSGAQINVITRSGTNDIHGTAFEFFRNNLLDARNFFATVKPKNRYNNFGGTVGGPVKKDKIFVFLSNEYRRILQSTGTRTGIVPTPAQIAGDFSGGAAIKDPDTGAAFPGNRIPTTRLDPNAVVLTKNYYLPPTPGFQRGALNFSSSLPDGTNYRSGLGRIDYNLRPNFTIFGRYNIDSALLSNPFALGNPNTMPNVAATQQANIMYTANVSATWTATPSTLNEFTTAWYHGNYAISTLPFASRTRVPGFNVPTLFNSNTDASGLIPEIAMGQGYAGIAVHSNQNTVHYDYQLIDNISHIRGRHTFKFGGSIDKGYKATDGANAFTNGSFTFDGTVTGNALADLMLGRSAQYKENSAHPWIYLHWTDFALYFQDQFRVNSRLSLTYGIRWEIFPPESSVTNSRFEPGLFNFAKASKLTPDGQIVPGTENFLNGVVLAAQDTDFGTRGRNTVHDTFAPRFGFAYTLTKDNLTVLRGGYGMFHNRWNMAINATRGNYPNNQSASIFNTRFSDPGQGSLRVFPVAFSNNNSPWEIPYIQQWSLGVQRQLPGTFLLDVNYVGNRGAHLLRTYDLNQPLPSVAVANGSVSPNAVRPFLGFAAINNLQTVSNSFYHALQTSVVRRFAAGLSVQLSYTFSKVIDDTGTPPNTYSPLREERAISSGDRTHVLVASYVWEVPFTRGLKGWQRKAFHGWQVSGISSFQSGNPLTMTISGDRAGVGGSAERPNLNGPVERLHTLSSWFTTGVFSIPALGTFGNAGRALVRGPGINDWDFSFSKRTVLKERSSGAVALQFRAEFFNFFNHTQYNSVGTVVGSATFGQVTAAYDPRLTQLGLRLLF